MTQRWNSERGLGMLEFAIILPVLFLVVAGLIDYGHLIRQLNTLSLVARDAARTAAAHARTGRISTPNEIQVMCDNPSYPASAVSCAADDAGLQIQNYVQTNATATPDSVVLAAKKAACLGLRRAELDGNDYDVTTVIVDDGAIAGGAAGVIPQELRLRIEMKPTARKCLLCWGNLIANVPLRGDSVFVLEDRCR